MQRQLGGLAEHVPQRNVERRLCHGGDAAAAESDGRLPQILPDLLDRAGVLADDPRDDDLLQAGDDRLDARAEQEQITHAGDAALGLDVEHQKIAAGAEGMAFEPRRLRPRHPQHGRTDGGDGQIGNIGHENTTLPDGGIAGRA